MSLRFAIISPGAAVLTLLVLVVGCHDDYAGSRRDVDRDEVGADADDTDVDGGNIGDPWAALDDGQWTREVVPLTAEHQPIDASQFALEATDRRIGIAFYSAGEIERCGLEDPHIWDRQVWNIWYAETTGPREWTIEQVASIGTLWGPPRGIDLTFVEDQPVVATPIGEPGPLDEKDPSALTYQCATHDAGYHRRQPSGGWETVTVARFSGDAPAGIAAADFGWSVGAYPAIAEVDGELVLVYRDEHAPFIQAEDSHEDVEVAWGTELNPVLPNHGAGQFLDAAAAPDGNLVIAHAHQGPGAEVGLWVGRGGRSANWSHLHLHDYPGQPRVAVAPDGRIWVAHQPADGTVELFEHPSESFTNRASWAVDVISDPSLPTVAAVGGLSVSSEGRPTAAWTHCSTSDFCDPRTPLVFASPADNGRWQHEILDDAPDGFGAARHVYGPGERAVVGFTTTQGLGLWIRGSAR